MNSFDTVTLTALAFFTDMKLTENKSYEMQYKSYIESHEVSVSGHTKQSEARVSGRD